MDRDSRSPPAIRRRSDPSQPQTRSRSNSRHVGGTDRAHPSYGRHVHVARSPNRRFHGGRSLDERTWVDLNLDEVFAAIDRTQSTLGQHALYHRLRTAPVADHLEAFEALVRRITLDPAARERAQVALARLQDPHGYDVWWLASADAVERRSWYFVFPGLTAAAIVLAVVAPFWSAAVMPLVAVLVVNVAVRYATDFQIGTIARSFRQCAPLDCDGRIVAVSRRR